MRLGRRKGADDGKTDALQRQDETGLPDGSDDFPERKAGSRMGGDRGNTPVRPNPQASVPVTANRLEAACFCRPG